MGKLLKAAILSAVLCAVALYILISTFAPGKTPAEKVKNTKEITGAELAKAKAMLEAALPEPASPGQNSGLTVVIEGGAKTGDGPARPAAQSADAAPVQPTLSVEAAASVEALPPAPPAPPRYHVVADGDTLSSISQTYYGTSRKWKLIQEANSGLTPETLRLGAKILIPENAPGEPFPPALPDGPGEQPAAATREYVVAEGDTLFNIAERVLGNGNRYPEILKANPGLKPESLGIGSRILVPVPNGRG